MGQDPYIPYNSELKERSREMRKNPTPAEKVMWFLLTHDPIFKKYRFLRQKPIDQYIVDFYCSELMLAIEIDGTVHNKTQEYDNIRSDNLKEFGIKVIRFNNDEVLLNAE